MHSAQELMRYWFAPASVGYVPPGTKTLIYEFVNKFKTLICVHMKPQKWGRIYIPKGAKMPIVCSAKGEARNSTLFKLSVYFNKGGVAHTHIAWLPVYPRYLRCIIHIVALTRSLT